MSTVVGPLGALFSLRLTQDRDGNDSATLRVESGGRPARNPNANVLLRRVGLTDPNNQEAAAALRRCTADAMFPSGRLLAAANARRDAAVDRLRRHGRHCVRLRVRPVWRVAVGLGEDNPTEVGLRLHGTYGVPVLPGSALKGVARAQARRGDDYDDYGPDVFGDEPPGSGEAGAATGADAGTGKEEAKAGKVMFLDALPETASTRSNPVVSDLVNPHASPYYRTRGSVAPAEYHQPVPVAFLAVSSAVSFRIHLVSGPHATGQEPELAAGWLRTALDDLGVGGKTSAGYGYLDVEVIPDPEPPPAAGEAGGR